MPNISGAMSSKPCLIFVTLHICRSPGLTNCGWVFPLSPPLNNSYLALMSK